MVIDLRPENTSFRDAFYQLMRKGLGAKSLGLDLSYTLILGDFVGSDLGLRTPLYAQAIAQRRLIKSFRNSSELLTLADIDLEKYTQLSKRLIVSEPLSIIGWLLQAWSWLGLSVLLLLSGYVTNFWVVLGVGGVAIAYFGLLFWLVDRYRRLHPVPIIPTFYEPFRY